MKLHSLIATGLLAAISLSLTPCSEAQTMSRSGREMYEATMSAYDKIIAENPGDYQALYRRANGYYGRNSYGKALSDINEAIKLAPASETSFLLDAYNLRAGIYERLDKHDLAIADYRKALAISPKDYNSLYQLANNEFEAGDYNAAKADYQQLRKLNPRSQEAMFGLARVALKENDITSANRLLKEAVDLNPTAATTYMRQASVLRMMGNNTDAVDAYTVALSLDRSVMPAALHEMVEISRTDYNAVMNGLQKAIDKNPRGGTCYYIRAIIAKSHFHYLPALADLNLIVERNLLSLPSVYTQMAECYYNLGDYATALEKADIAIGSSKDNRDAYIMKSAIKRAQKAWPAAVENADKALAPDAAYAPALMAKGLAQEGYGLYPEANVSMGRAITADKRRPAYYMARAYLLKNGMSLPAQAPAFYNDVLKLGYPADQAVSLYGFAQLFLGNTAEGDAWINNLTANVADGDGEIAYYAACYWAQRGDADKALKYTEDALKAGYASYHNWTLAIDGGVNVGPIREDPRFVALLERYGNLFK